ncbi:MAG TPA: YceI family protein [Bacteroidia bacterium]|jgi:polyisoprenoid-binding protein YceI|nr:YceI family protein [Bacteroidia bacterium]
METAVKTKWNIDKAHSEIHFKAKHLMITTVTGSLKEYDADIETAGDDFSTATVHFSGEVKSLSTGQEQRDGHLQAEDFFDAANHPKLTFDSTLIRKISDNTYKVDGNLSIRGNTKAITLNMDFGGIAKDPWGNTKAGLTLSGKINRKDFGLKFHVLNEAGNMLVSDEIRIEAEVQLAKA